MYKRAGQAPTHTEIALNTFRHSNSNALGFFVIHVVFFLFFGKGSLYLSLFAFFFLAAMTTACAALFSYAALPFCLQ